MRIHHATTLLCSLSFLLGAAPPSVREVEAAPFSSQEIIACDSNKPNIQLLKVLITEREKAIGILLAKKNKKKIEEQENKDLLEQRLGLMEPRAKLAFREFLEYYCENPDKIPKSKDAELDLTNMV